MKVSHTDYAKSVCYLLLFLVVHDLLEKRGELVHAHRAEVAVRAVARGNGAVLHVAVADDHHVGDLLHLPVTDRAADYCAEQAKKLEDMGFRVEVDYRNEKIGRKIRDNELKRIPYLLIVGEKEEAEGLVSVRAQGEGDKGQMTLEAFRDYMTDLVSHEIDANKMEQKN